MASGAAVSRWRILDSIRRRRQLIAHAHRQQQKAHPSPIGDPSPSSPAAAADLYDQSLFADTDFARSSEVADLSPAAQRLLSLLHSRPLPLALAEADPPPPSADDVCSVVDSLAADNKPILALQTLMWYLRNPNFDPFSSSSASSSIMNLGRRIAPLLPPPKPPSIDQFLVDLRSFWNNPAAVPMPPYLFEPLLSLYCHAARTFEETMEAFDLSISKGASPSIQHYNKVLKSAVSRKPQNDSDWYQRQRDEEGEDVVVAGKGSENQLAQDIGKAQQLFNRMRKSGAPAPDIISYNILIYGYGLSGNSIEALHLFDEMISAGFPPNESTYSSLISGLVKTESMDRASQLLQEMKYNGFRPSFETYSSLLQGHCAKGNHKAASSLLKEMRGQGHELDALSFDAFLTSLSKALQVNRDEARKLLEGDAV